MSDTRTTFWCLLGREDGSTHGAALPSPGFGTQAQLTSWIRAHRLESDEVRAWRRETREGACYDTPLMERDEPGPDRERLRATVQTLKDDIDRKKKELDRGRKAHPAGSSA